ncbi:MAG: type 1 glutamine amidotransferase [Phycisphaerales bacterium]
MAIIVLQHSDICGAGRLGMTLRDHGFKMDIRRVHAGDRVPTDFEGVDGVMSLGGPQNVGEDHPFMEREYAFLKEAHERQLPVVGICLGAQMIAHALGGDVAKMAAPEVGFPAMDIGPVGQTDTILAGVAWRSHQFQAHGYEVTKLPAGATLLASSAKCKVQAFRAGMRTYGFQFHPECDKGMARAIATDSAEFLHSAGLTKDEFEKQMAAHYDEFARLSDRMCVNIATALIPRYASAVRV